MTNHTYTIGVAQELYVQNCCVCGILFGVPDSFDTYRRNDHTTFFCPVGHPQSYIGPSKAEREATDAKLRADRLAQRLASREDDLRAERMSHAATKGQLTKVKRRAHAAVCPHCNRSFVQVRRHIVSQHPEAAAESGLVAEHFAAPSSAGLESTP